MIDDVFYEKLRPQDAADIVAEHLGRGPRRRAADAQAARRPRRGQRRPTSTSSSGRTKIVLRNCGAIDPQRIEDYIARDGYQALAKVAARRTIPRR